MNQPLQTLTFQLKSPEARAWVVLTSDDQEPQVLEMERRNTAVWSASADLIPGNYQCRYYCGDDHNVNYHGPAHIDNGIDCGMDTLVSVGVAEPMLR
jgi:hypothetical protein